MVGRDNFAHRVRVSGPVQIVPVYPMGAALVNVAMIVGGFSMDAPRRLVLIDKITGVEIWEYDIYHPLHRMTLAEIRHIFYAPLSIVPRAELVSGRMYFAWR